MPSSAARGSRPGERPWAVGGGGFGRAPFLRWLKPTMLRTFDLGEDLVALLHLAQQPLERAPGTFFGSVTTGISMCGRELKIFSSTTLGSTMISRTSFGLFE